MTTAEHRPRRTPRVLFYSVIILAGLVLSAIVYDMGRLSLVRSQLQTAADNAALASATRLDHPRDELLGQARKFAGHFLSSSDATRQADVHVELGSWDGSHRRFTPDDSQGAVRVTCRLGGQDRQGEVQLFFGRWFGLDSIPVAATAVATADEGRASREPRAVATHEDKQIQAAAQVRLVQ